MRGFLFVFVRMLSAMHASMCVACACGCIQVHNPALALQFEAFKGSHSGSRVLRMFHGTKRASAEAIAAHGFRLPTSCERADVFSETGLETFGIACYFAYEPNKAAEFGCRQVGGSCGFKTSLCVVPTRLVTPWTDPLCRSLCATSH